jgi:2,5-diamino-6-(ribosylamino)-4(3H)-pyrimidinone 5'-phosphate reductase
MSHKPYIILNVAMTLDGKIDTDQRQGAKISSDEDWQRVDQLRAEVDAVMVGGRTLVDEDPRLTVKSAALQAARIDLGKSPNPAKVGIISDANIALDGRFLTEGNPPIYIFTTRKTNSAQIQALRKKGVFLDVDDVPRVNLAKALGTLQEKGIQKVLVEGGGILNSTLLHENLVDEIQVYLAPLIFGGAEAPTLADGLGLSREAAIQLILISSTTTSKGGIITQYKVNHSNRN